jgi:hypothetical protein
VNAVGNSVSKVTLTKPQSDALISALEDCHGDKAHIVEWHRKGVWSSKRKALNDLELDTIIRALYLGYEVQNPEEKVREYFLEHLLASEQKYDAGVLDGIRTTLNYLNILIKGVNC